MREKDTDKPILDACCGSRMFWFDKNNPSCLFIDNRSEIVYAKDSGAKTGERRIDVNPDFIADFTQLPIEDESFYMVVFDPPHLKTLGKNSWMAKKYGRLPNDWEFMIQKAFNECFRVLKPYGTLIFKWNESEIMSSQVLRLIPYTPLFGHTTGRQSKTIWMSFMKCVSDKNIQQNTDMSKKPRCPHPTPIPLYLGDTVEYDQVDELSDTNRNVGVLERTDGGQWIISTANPDRMDYDESLWRGMKLIKRGDEE